MDVVIPSFVRLAYMSSEVSQLNQENLSAPVAPQPVEPKKRRGSSRLTF